HSPQVLTTVRKKHIRILITNEGIWNAKQPIVSPFARESSDALAYIMNTDIKPSLKITEKIHTYEMLVKDGKINSQEAKDIKNKLDENGYEIPESDLELWKFLAERKNNG
ncbi:MAG: hypothetical protein KAH84_08195, partial [Thiomargarita sp.]|nr:hypothetical protein [Thiomargarita sp.]